MTWSPETNRIPTGLLTPEELAELKSQGDGFATQKGESHDDR